MSESVSIVFGSTGSIGKSIAQDLSNRGNTLVLCARDQDKLQAQKQELNAAATFVIDIEKPESFQEVFAQAKDQFDKVDSVVNAIGSLLLKPAHITSVEDFENTIKINLFSSFYVLQGATKIMSRTKGGSIVLISSAAARVGMANHEAIAAAKGGIEAMARSAASSYAPRDIRINVVAPGMVETNMTESLLTNEASKKASVSMHALGRIGQPDDIARAVTFLMDEQQSWITGQVIGVDGGLSNVRTRA